MSELAAKEKPVDGRGTERGMYLPPHFEEPSRDEIAALIRDFPLAVVAASTPEGLIANHLPLFPEGEDALVGHVAEKNDMHRLLAEGQEVLAIFRGEEGYVSPNLYPSKAVHHRHVPTWNYQVVHVHGAIAFQHDEKAKRAAVGRLTRVHETRMNGAAAWRMADAPADFMTAMLDGIVAFRIAISRIVAKSKLSQNREPADFGSVAGSFEARGLDGIAGRMRRIARERDG
jgi:transcriptional regulator